jgi:hypothetical protein
VRFPLLLMTTRTLLNWDLCMQGPFERACTGTTHQSIYMYDQVYVPVCQKLKLGTENSSIQESKCEISLAFNDYSYFIKLGLMHAGAFRTCMYRYPVPVPRINLSICMTQCTCQCVRN